MEKNNVQIFVSSTYQDLINYRNSVRLALQKMKCVVSGMEIFGSTSNSPLQECLQKVREADLFICIIAHRYGSIEENSQKSFTQLEFEEAKKNNIPILIYIIDDNQPIIPKFIDEGIQREKLLEFKGYLRKIYTISTFNEPSDLSLQVSIDVSRELKKITNNRNLEDCDFIVSEINYNRYELRPKKFNNAISYIEFYFQPKYEFTTSYEIKIVPSEDAKALNLEIGDSIYVNVMIVNQNVISLYAQGYIADWLEEIYNFSIEKMEARLRVIYKAKTKFISGIAEYIEWAENGVLAISDLVKGVLLLEKPVIVREEDAFKEIDLPF